MNWVKRYLICLLLCFLISQSLGFASPKVQIQYFYSPYCHLCQTIKENFLPKLLSQYDEEVTVTYYDVTTVEDFQTLLTLEKSLGRTINKTPPLMIIGTDTLEGNQAIQKNLQKTIEKHLQLADLKISPGKLEPKNPQLLWEAFQNLTLLTVVGAGLLDGINPCAFTTIIFLLSYLSFLGKKGKELLITGMLFTVGVFVAYVLIGFGLLEIFKGFELISLWGRVFKWIMVTLAVIFGLLNLYDFFLIRQGKIQETKLQLSLFWKKKIHEAIRTQSKKSVYAVTGFGLGFMVALFEFPCTGQVYFPVVFMLQQVHQARNLALSYLLIYNLMFILPLIVVFGLAYKGLSSERLSQVMLKHASWVKLGTAVLFLGMAGVLVMFKL